jgi:cytochrome c oxidase subunit 3
MGLLQKLTEKPWEVQGTNRALPGSGEGGFSIAPQKVALNTFIAVLSVMFGLFIIAYYIRMDLDDWRPLPEPSLLWVNTVILFLCSLSLLWTKMQVSKNDIQKVRWAMITGGILTIAFVFGQILAWRELNEQGYYLNTNPANAFFFLLTGIHALHLLGGLWVWTRASFRIWFGAKTEDIRLSVELCSTYWHFLLLVWLVLFGLLSYT